VPATWSSLGTYFMITVILSLLGWTGLCRTLRGMTLRLRQSDLVTAAKCIGASDSRIILRHVMPYNASLIIVVASLSVPHTIIGETSLSFLGLGIRPPMVSWGVLLAQAQNVSNVAFHPWLMWPAAFIIITVLAFNFIGDGIRDAADPYTH
ncbi:MAG: ABC transporter permease, partial [Kiritimatiellota bacterium]|nr:ABC transporter permease [Kiritimatiellota bacterium]